MGGEVVEPKTLYTLAVRNENSIHMGHLSATMDARQVLKKVAP